MVLLFAVSRCEIGVTITRPSKGKDMEDDTAGNDGTTFTNSESRTEFYTRVVHVRICWNETKSALAARRY